MSHVGSKGYRAGGTMRSAGLTGSGENVPGILPRARKGEMKRLRAKIHEMDFMNPEMWQYANGQKLRHYLVLACNRITELERKLQEMFKP